MRPKNEVFIMPTKLERGRIEPLYDQYEYGWKQFCFAIAWTAYLVGMGFVLYRVALYAWHITAFAKILK